MSYKNKKIFFLAIVSYALFAQHDGIDKRIRYDASRDERNLPDKNSNAKVDEGIDDFNAKVLKSNDEKGFVDENVDRAISVVKKEQDTGSGWDELLDRDDFDDNDVIVENIIDENTHSQYSQYNSGQNSISKNTDIKSDLNDRQNSIGVRNNEYEKNNEYRKTDNYNNENSYVQNNSGLLQRNDHPQNTAIKFPKQVSNTQNNKTSRQYGDRKGTRDKILTSAAVTRGNKILNHSNHGNSSGNNMGDNLINKKLDKVLYKLDQVLKEKDSTDDDYDGYQHEFN